MHMLTSILKEAPPQMTGVLFLQLSHLQGSVVQALAFLVFLDPSSQLSQGRNSPGGKLELL